MGRVYLLGVVNWYHTCFGNRQRGFDSLHPDCPQGLCASIPSGYELVERVIGHMQVRLLSGVRSITW